jgi:phosphatidylglycerophosphate synthase
VTRSRGFALVAVASVTDFLDGWLARRQHATTRLGALIDPIADRVFVFTAVCAFLVEGAISTASYFTLLSRDIIDADRLCRRAIGAVAARGRVPRALAGQGRDGAPAA